MNNTKEFNEMLKQTIDFYNGLGIIIKKGNERHGCLAILPDNHAILNNHAIFI